MQNSAKKLQKDSINFQPNKLDLVISAVYALLFPLIASILYKLTGALLPMIIYYTSAWGISKWRRGKTGYWLKPKDKHNIMFYLNIFVILIALVFSYLARIEVPNYNLIGMLLTAFIWAPINASSEQLLWIYIFESWDLYKKDISSDINEHDDGIPKNINWANRIIGLVFFSVFVGMIHTLYWVNFLEVTSAESIYGVIFVLLTTISGFFHIIVWRRSGNMIFTFIPHFILNFLPLFWTGYSIIPFLL